MQQERTSGSVTVSILGNEEKFDLLNALQFSSDRKRMSIICRNDKGELNLVGNISGELKLYCKGADSVIYERMATGQEQTAAATLEHLNVIFKHLI